MNDSILPIRSATFGDKAWKPFQDYGFAARDVIVPISPEEIGRVALAFPIAFTAGKNPVPVALMGLQPGRNLFVAGSGQWVATYVPAALRAYPFKLLRVDDEQFALGYDQASGLLVAAGEGEPFFDAENRPTERVGQTLQFLIRLNRGQRVAASLAMALATAGVLEAWPLKIKDGDKEIPVEGILRVSESALTALPDAAFLQLRQEGALALAYAQLLSMANIAKFGQMASLHADMQHRQQQAVQSMFSGDASDEQIDWDAVLKTN